MNQLIVLPVVSRASLRYWEQEGPRTDKGDPAFQALDEVKTFFSDLEIAALCNKALYAIGYNKDYHRARQEKRKEERKVLRDQERMRKIEELRIAAQARYREHAVRAVPEDFELPPELEQKELEEDLTLLNEALKGQETRGAEHDVDANEK